jgi:hypothetical protein
VDTAAAGTGTVVTRAAAERAGEPRPRAAETTMDLGMIMSALPWLKRIWKVLPPPLRIPILLVVAAVAVWYVITGREDLKQQVQEQLAERGIIDERQPSTA